VSGGCSICRFLRVVLLGSAGAIAGAWLAPRLGFDERELIMPATLGALAALALGVLIFRPRR
jgi:uncharacterized membrane protein YeaQ/YmgE (transglycosylase-associated protein family)